MIFKINPTSNKAYSFINIFSVQVKVGDVYY